MMMKAAADINWHYPGDAIPAFVTMALMPFTYSIAYGLIGGIMTYVVLNTVVWVIEKVSGGRIVPYNKDTKEPWNPPRGLFPSWAMRAAKGDKQFWKDPAHRGATFDVSGSDFGRKSTELHTMEGLEDEKLRRETSAGAASGKRA
jgi:adenine/guanine/hypoxanthine permease